MSAEDLRVTSGSHESSSEAYPTTRQEVLQQPDFAGIATSVEGDALTVGVDTEKLKTVH